MFPQFATHNAQTVATIHHMAGPDFTIGDYEFQCLHGMGDRLYTEVVGKTGLARPCRIYAPVGSHRTLLAYLVRRLLENGANSSFVNRIADRSVPVEDLLRDPVDEAAQILPLGAPHPLIAAPRRLFRDRENSRGLDLKDDRILSRLGPVLTRSTQTAWYAAPLVADLAASRVARQVSNPADDRDHVGNVEFALARDAELAARNAAAAFANWSETPVAQRATCLDIAAAFLEARMESLLGLLVREAGKTLPNAVAEVREAVDFLRYYAQQARDSITGTQPLGPIVCISPWNFPLAIFVGQIAAALVAGNTVLAKPAEETPLIAAQAVSILHEAGIPAEALQFLPGEGEIGAVLVAAPQICGVVFTGSTEVAKLIQAQLAERRLTDGAPIPLIAETGGQNAMLVDSSALPEQVVRDVLASAFDSAGQRCSALRILCLQEDIADDIIAMLRGAMAELRVGNPAQLSTDVGPVIGEAARATICEHIEGLRSRGYRIEQAPLGPETRHGSFVAPTIVEIASIAELGREVFGPVLHVMRYRRADIAEVVRQIDATGYGLTFGLHSRIDETVASVTAAVGAGNLYVNRNVVGAIVGVQPFGGRALSGTGPKAGGPLYLGRLVREGVDRGLQPGRRFELPGPVGERNLYGVQPRGRVLLVPATVDGLCNQLAAVYATGNIPFLPDRPLMRKLVAQMDPAIGETIGWSGNWMEDESLVHVLVEDTGEDIRPILRGVAGRAGPIPIVQLGGGAHRYRLDWMLDEISISIDTTAAGGNASLLTLA